VYWLAPLMVLWANLHGGFVVGFLFLGVALAARLGEWLVRRDRRLLHDVRRLALLTMACVAAGLLTPNTYRLFAYAVATQASPAQQNLIMEWFSPDFHAAEMRPFELLVLALLVGFAVSRPRPYDVLLALLSLAGPLLTRGRPRSAAALFAIVAWTLLVVPVATVEFSARTAVPGFGPLAAAAAVGGWGVLAAVRGRRSRAERRLATAV
jgi:hypothetical protein